MEMEKSKLIKIVIASVALLAALILIGRELTKSTTPGPVAPADPSAPPPTPRNRAVPPPPGGEGGGF